MFSLNIFETCFRTDSSKNHDTNKKHIEYFANGSVKKIYYLNSQKHFNGEYTEYRENGKLWVHCYYLDDGQVGIYRQYDITGKLYHAYNYDTHTFLTK